MAEMPRQGLKFCWRARRAVGCGSKYAEHRLLDACTTFRKLPMPSSMLLTQLLRSGAAAFGALWLAGCALVPIALVPIAPGATRADVLAKYGKPSAEVALPVGTRLQYSYQPAGQSAWMVDLDASGRVVSAKEALTLQEFSKIGLGRWTRTDVQREFGRPATVNRVASWPGDVMVYRWLDATTPMFFWVYLDAGNVVQRTGQGFDLPLKEND